MTQDEMLTLSYLAGFLDGEGCISILKRVKGKWNASYFIQIVIGQKDGQTLDWIQKKFGGRVYIVKRDCSYTWNLTNKKAYEFIKILTPFLKYKKPQAELAIKFYEERLIGNNKRSRKDGLSQEELKLREEMLQEMKLLKTVFVKSTCNNNGNSDND
jgi:hypothetical protein